MKNFSILWNCDTPKSLASVFAGISLIRKPFRPALIASSIAKLLSEREHITPFFTKNPKKFKLFNYLNNKDFSNIRLTVDYKKDLNLIKEIYHRMKPKTTFSLPSILKIIKNDPKLLKINQGIKPNEGYLKSLKHDRKIK